MTPALAIWRVRLREGALDFSAGQYATLGAFEGQRLIERPHSICSAPDEPELEFFIELIDNGRLTPILFRMHPGDEIFVRRPAKGRFRLSEETRDHLMIASVTGVAPFVSMLRTLSRHGDGSRRVLLLHSASLPDEFGYADELSALACACPWFEYVPCVSRAWLAPAWQGERGRVEDILRKHTDPAGFTPGRATAYCCGNPQMIRNVRGVLERAGFARAAVREEQYWPG